MFAKLRCRLSGHVRSQRRIWDDGLNWRSECVRCGASLIKDERDQWRAFDERKDASPRRREERQTSRQAEEEASHR
ncbi:hypothetical protein HZF05_21245 [Sphingomonas sp. CGMCC 1.13654]|uniref:Uncharacterized protein n=1 Tax=Sphingomonas chungangi TaxID=2683589 RepID=A0A838LB29_9SPHN|nr:hypothetical protein [Sphingomonas chungangi]MBA2936613.1 hypothetical protein [Sphingomonas chungangi]MVW55998.1 hypothetical protein [Sphingomonas chungangi]